jgi:hypothetical protein
VHVVLRVAALLVAEHEDLPLVELRHAADDRGVVAEAAVAVQLDEVVHEQPDVIHHVRPPGVAGELDLLLRRELREDLLLELLGLLLELADLRREVDRGRREVTELADLLLEIDDRPLELQDHAIRELRWNGFGRHLLARS